MINPNYDLSYINIGSVLERQGKYQEAIFYFDQAIQMNPHNYKAHNSKGSTLEKLAKYDQALQCYDKAIALNPGHQYSCNNKGSCDYYTKSGEALLKLGQIARSISCFDDCLRINKNFTYALYNKSYAQHCLNQYQEGAYSYLTALQQDSKIEDQYINDAYHQIINKEFSDALKILCQVITMNPKKQKAIQLINYCVNGIIPQNPHQQYSFSINPYQNGNIINGKQVKEEQDQYDLQKDQKFKSYSKINKKDQKAQKESQKRTLKYLKLSNRYKKQLKDLKKTNDFMRIELDGYKQQQGDDLKLVQLRRDLQLQRKSKVTPQNQNEVLEILKQSLPVMTSEESSYFKTFYWTMINLIFSYVECKQPSPFTSFLFHLGILNRLNLNQRETFTLLELVNQQPYFQDFFPNQFITIYVRPQLGVTGYLNNMLLSFDPQAKRLEHKSRIEHLRKFIGYPYQDQILLMSQVILDLALATLKITQSKSKELEKGLTQQFPNQYKQDHQAYTDYIQNQLFQQGQYSQKAGSVAYQDAIELILYIFSNQHNDTEHKLHHIVWDLVVSKNKHQKKQ